MTFRKLTENSTTEGKAMEETKEVDEKDVELENVPLNEAQEVKL